jgi:hypothetical protein
MRGDIANAYTHGHCHAYSDSYSDCNTNTERNTDSDTYCDSERVAYGYAKGNAQAARDTASAAVTLISE